MRHCAAYWEAAHDGAKGHLVGLCQVTVPGDVYADVRLWQAEVRAAGLAGLYIPEVARLDIVYPSRRGMLWQEFQVPLEMGPLLGIIPDSVAVALEPHSARIQGRQGLPGVQARLAVQWDFGDIPRGPRLRRCGVVWCGVVWCGVVWCAEGAITKWQRPGWSCT